MREPFPLPPRGDLCTSCALPTAAKSSSLLYLMISRNAEHNPQWVAQFYTERPSWPNPKQGCVFKAGIKPVYQPLHYGQKLEKHEAVCINCMSTKKKKKSVKSRCRRFSLSWCLTSSAVSSGEISTLDHELLDDSVELAALITKSFLFNYNIKKQKQIMNIIWYIWNYFSLIHVALIYVHFHHFILSLSANAKHHCRVQTAANVMS